MSCPFAKYATLAADVDSKYSHYLNYHAKSGRVLRRDSNASRSTPALSEYLKTATAKAHREVESSQGVRKIMGFGSSHNNNDDGDFVFGRLDYVRWMVMLACIYAALESSLIAQDASISNSMLAPLLRSTPGGTQAAGSLLSHLLRFQYIMADVQVHLDILADSTGNEEGAGLTWTELLEEVRESHSNVDSSSSRSELKQLVATIPQGALLAGGSTWSTAKLSADHIDLLSQSECEATLIYTQRLLALSTFIAPGIGSDLLLSQAYVRYLGDLSGGQHIRRRVEKLFPVRAHGGFAFYAFNKPAAMVGSESEWHHTLKDAFRCAMDAAVENAAGDDSQLSRNLLGLQGREASLAFELNKDMFEGIIGNAPTTTVPPLPTKEDFSVPVAARTSTAVAVAPAKVSSGCPVTATLQFLTALTSLPVAAAAATAADGSAAAPPSPLLLHGMPVYSHVLPATVLGLAVLLGGTSIALSAF